MLQLGNDAKTTMAVGINTTATTIPVTDGSIFPRLNTGNWFPLTVTDGTDVERVKVTAVVGNDLTVERAAEGTTALFWVSGVDCLLSLSSDSLIEMMNDGVSSDTSFTTELKTAGIIQPSTTYLGDDASYATEVIITDDESTLEEISFEVDSAGSFFIAFYEVQADGTYNNYKELAVTSSVVGTNTFKVSDGTLTERVSLKNRDMIGVRLPNNGPRISYKSLAGGNWVTITGDAGVGSNVVRTINNNDFNLGFTFNYEVVSRIEGGSDSATGNDVVLATDEAIQRIGINYGLRTLDSTYAYLSGDSTVAAHVGGTAIFELLDTIRLDGDISAPGNTINQQLNAWIGISGGVSDATTGYVVVQIGLNDMDYTEAASVALARLQAYIDRIRSDIGPSHKIIISNMIPAKQQWINIYGAVNGLVAQQKWLDMNEAIMGLGANPITGTDYQVDAHVPLMDDGAGNLRAEYNSGDDIHPNTAGRTVNATALRDAIRDLGFVV